MKNIAIHGAFGKMGRAIARLSQAKGMIVEAAIAPQFDRAPLSEGILKEKLYPEINNKALANIDAVIDFSIPEASLHCLQECVLLNKPVVIGTTGFSPAQEQLITDASRKIAVLKSSNMSIGVNLLFALAGMAAKALQGKGYDAELMEIHHSQKKDSPSGTAKSLEKIVLENMLPHGRPVYGREGIVGARKSDEMGVMALRGGDVVGDHTLYFLGDGERIELKHQAVNRDVFARGALDAALFLISKPAGLYSMKDVLKL